MSALTKPDPRRTDEDEIEIEAIVPEGQEFPPETASILTWSAIKFIRSPSSVFLLWSVVSLAVAFFLTLVISNFVTMDITVKAQGEVISDFGTRPALSHVAGQVSEVRKHQGETVAENEVIATIMLDSNAESGIQTAMGFLDLLEQKMTTLQDSKAGQFVVPKLPNVKLSLGPAFDAMINLESQGKLFVDLKSRAEAGSSRETKPLKQRATLLEGKLQKIKRSHQRQYLEMYQDSTQEELGRIRAQIAAAENETQLKLAQAFGDFLKSVRSAKGALEGYLSQREVKAPISGVIGKLYASESSWIDLNKPIAIIIPKDGKLMAAIHVYSKDIVKVASNQKILYKVEAYPYQSYGSFPGAVLSFEQAKDSPLFGGREFEKSSVLSQSSDYVVYGAIDFPANLSAELRSKTKLVLGMKFDAEIITDRKSIRSIIWDSLFKQGIAN
jgi:membrane fusion protein